MYMCMHMHICIFIGLQKTLSMSVRGIAKVSDTPAILQSLEQNNDDS